MQNPFDELNKQMKDQQQIMTRRDYFAAMAMQSLCSNKEFMTETITDVVKWSVKISDLLIEELRK